MSAIAKNNVFYGAVEPIPINDGSTSATETWSGQYLNQEFTAINSTLPQKKTISATTDANGFFTLPTANETPIGIKNVKFDGVTTQAKYEFMWNTNNTYAIKLMTWNNQTHANKNVTLDLIYVVV